MSAYYNENNALTADWLEALIKAQLLPGGEVDRRSIEDVAPEDLAGFNECHFFAGIGGWPYALRLADWPSCQPVWSGSCPCQPFSVAGKRRGEADERHLWPAFARLIEKRRPAIVFGEQVASKAGREWMQGVRSDLEEMGYAIGAADLCAASVGAPHPRQRLYWVAHAERLQQRGQKQRCRSARRVGRLIEPVSWDCGWEAALRLLRGVDDGLSYGVGITDGFRNAIVPALAKEFILSAQEAIAA